MRLDDEDEAKWFRVMGLSITAVGSMTDFNQGREGARHRRAA